MTITQIEELDYPALLKNLRAVVDWVELKEDSVEALAMRNILWAATLLYGVDYPPNAPEDMREIAAQRPLQELAKRYGGLAGVGGRQLLDIGYDYFLRLVAIDNTEQRMIRHFDALRDNLPQIIEGLRPEVEAAARR